MTSRSWKLVYGELAWAALLFGTVHVLIMGVEGWDDLEKWPGRMPPITLTSTLIPMYVPWHAPFPLFSCTLNLNMFGLGL